ncbi:MAG: RidA family protein [Candidatus Latescibacteria bacterium]|nr:RidA family protein [Candidatus Latescibacterota bacterium]
MKRRNIPTSSPFGAEFGYSRAVRADRHIHVAGTCADAYEQARSALGIIAGALDETGASLEDVVRTVVYITDVAHADGVTRAHREVFGEILPASTLVVIAALLKPHLVVEIEAYALVDSA